VAVVYALVTGLAKKVVEVIRAPIETKVIEEVRKPPPPPEIVVPPPPRLEAPPPPFIPPPEVQIAAPPPPQPTITAVTPTPPPAPVAIVPAPPPPAPAPPAPPPAAPPAPPPTVTAGVACSNYTTVMGDAGFPREAIRQGLDKGEALIQFTLTASGEIKDIKALRASHAIFARNSIRIVGEYKCQGQGRDVLVTVPFGYKLE
jgi:protein TonB